MRDDLVTRIKAEQPDTCMQDALTFAADDFFTDASAGLLTRSVSKVEDLSARGLKISCRKCKKYIDRVIGTIVLSHILTPLVCGEIAVVVTAATTPVGGSIAGFVCLDQAQRERKRLAAKGKVEQLRVSVGSFEAWDGEGGEEAGIAGEVIECPHVVTYSLSAALETLVVLRSPSPQYYLRWFDQTGCGLVFSTPSVSFASIGIEGLSLS